MPNHDKQKLADVERMQARLRRSIAEARSLTEASERLIKKNRKKAEKH